MAEESVAAPGKFEIDAVQFRLTGVGSGNMTFKVTVGGVKSGKRAF